MKSVNLRTHSFNPLYFFLRIAGIFSAGPLLFSFKSKGAENIPSKGGFILVSNHRSHLDPVMLGFGSKRMLSFVARDSLFQNPVFSWFIKSLNANPIKRGRVDSGALKLGAKLLSEGKGLVIFPEGTRSKNGELQEGKRGVAMLAIRTGVPVIPAWVEGTQNALPRGSRKLKSAPVLVTFGTPIKLEDLVQTPLTRESYEEALLRIMGAIKALCPS